VPSWEELSAIAAYFAPLPVEIISKQKPVVNLHANEDLAEQICAKLAERPHNLAELLDAFHNHHPNDVQKFVYQLKLAGKIIEDKAFFICNQYGGVKLI
jgi:hypothetical protein